MSIRNTVIPAVMVTLFATMSFAAGTDESSGRDETVVLSIFHHIGEQAKRDALDAITALFIAENPHVDVRIEAIDFSNYDATLRTRIAGGDAPDIMFGKAVRLSELIDAGHVMPLTDADFLDNVSPAALNSMSIEGVPYGVPMSISAMGIYYNRAIFDANGYTVPETYGELMTLARQMQRDGVTPFIFGFRDGWTAQVVFQSDFYGAPLRSIPDFFADTMAGNAEFGDYPAFASSLERYAQRLTFGNDDPFSVDYARSLVDFAAGRGAMLIQGLWALGDIRRNNPTGDFGFFLNPALDDPGADYLNIQADDGFMISSQTRHPDVARAFLAALSSAEGSAMWASIATAIPTALDVDVSELDPILRDVQEYIVSDRAFNFESLPGYTGQYDAAYRLFQEEFAADADRSIADSVDDLTRRFERIRATQ